MDPKKLQVEIYIINLSAVRVALKKEVQEMSKETIRKEFRKCLLMALYNNKTINKATYKQAQKNIEKEKGKEVA